MNDILPAADRLRFEEEARLYQEGARTEEEFRNARVPMGIYEQREHGVYMMRIRIPGGRMTAFQLMAVANAADLYGNGALHFTTRQDVQLHGLTVKSIVPALRALLKVGLHTRGGGGNTVRNITACTMCDLTGYAILNVYPFVRSLTQKLLLEPESYRLPRKLKIAFSACARDCPEGGFSDIGFMARWRDHRFGETLGFQVLVGGGLGARSAAAVELEPFVSPDEVYLVAAAIRSVYQQRGNSGDKNNSRLRFLVQSLGLDSFKRMYLAEKESLRDFLAWPIVPLEGRPQPVGDPSDIPAIRDPEMNTWASECVHEQTIAGFFAVTSPVSMGDITSASAGALAEWLWNSDLNEVRLTQQQNLLIPNVPGKRIPILYDFQKTAGIVRPAPPALSGMCVCAGAGTCQLGICRSKDVAAEIYKMKDNAYWRHPALRFLSIRFSGCMNQCARSTTAVLGFVGAARSLDGRSYPAYQVFWGGQSRGAHSSLAAPVGTVPARWITPLLDGFLDRLAAVLPRDADVARIIRTGRPILHACLAEFQQAPGYDTAPLFYRDWGADDQPFTTEDRGKGECSAGETSIAC
ncbi:MAG: hypothetical protein A3G34_05980 [Candidatus Lindowbacteria bacterium RIFCSPLOWO2_12_FULL_62_27]|nr:MAG: hypothetical protein A3G34_05980 [Candidatus Lindowbacteria bacterium RIFCSPLOWO2_12_FULL_62_27]OGH57475.1 MAG: hypothetical protein A3I06_06515 [Candidatus Lindowbacteria bacterium RIFCSPLOWO2_02_FULL_62_12]